MNRILSFLRVLMRDRSSTSRLNWLTTRSASFRLWQRIDPVWLSLALVLAMGLVLLGLVFGGLRHRSDVAEPVPDNRILGSLTAKRACFVTAATDLEGYVWASLRKDPSCASPTVSGGVARYDPVWRLWDDEVHPFAGDRGGIRPDSIARLDDTVWISGDDGGLARLDDKDWGVWLSQSRIEVNGSPLEQNQIADAAPLRDEAGLILATKTGQAVLYTSATSTWRNFGTLPGTGVVHRIVRSGDMLWVQRRSQLWTASIDAGATSLASPRRVLEGTVRSLVASEDSVVVLSELACKGGGVGCVKLARYSSDGEREQTLLDTSTAPQHLRPSDIRFAATVGASIVIAGPRGAWAYGAESRRWSLIEDAPITAFASDGDDLVALGGDGFVTRLDGDTGKPVRHSLSGQGRSVLTLGIGADRVVLASDATGSLWFVPAQGVPSERFKRTLPQRGQAAVAAISSSTADLFVLADGKIVTMDRESRAYQSVTRPDLARILETSAVRTFNGSPVFVAGGSRADEVVRIDPSRPDGASILALKAPGGVKSLGAVDERTALATTGDGRLLRLSTSGNALSVADLMDGQPPDGSSAADLIDIGHLGKDLLIAGRRGISRYYPLRRVWRQLTDQPVVAVEGAPDAGTVFAVDTAARLVRFDADEGGTPEPLIGGRAFEFPANAVLADAMIDPKLGLALLSADGRGGTVFEAYDPELRQSRNLAKVAGASGDAAILDLRGTNDWLLRVGKEAFRSNATPLPRAERSAGVVSGWIDPRTGLAITLEIDAATGARFLHRHGLEGAPDTCLYRGSVAKFAPEQVFQELDAETLVLSAPTSLQFYRTDARRWFEGRLGAGTYRTTPGYGAYWAQPTDAAGKLVRYDLGVFAKPLSSCAAEAPALVAREFEMAAVAPGADRVLHRSKGGDVLLSEKGGTDRTLFSPPDPIPVVGPPLRALLRDDEIWLAFPTGVMRYDVKKRSWSHVAEITARDWVQVTLEEGEGAFSGMVVASYATLASWQSVRIPAMARTPKDAVLQSGAFTTPAALPPAVSSRHVLEAWSDESLVYLRLEDRLVALDRRTTQWINPDWPMDDGQERLGVVSKRIVSWSAAGRRLRYQDRPGGEGAFGPPRTVTVPEGAQALLAANGTPAWVTAAGGLVTCADSGTCSRTVADARLFDPESVARVIDVGSGLVVIGVKGGGSFLPGGTAPKPRRLFDTPPPALDAPFADWLTEDLVYLWPARSGGAHFAQDAKGRIVRLSGQNGRTPERLNPSVAQGALLAFNPEDDVRLGLDGTLRQQGRDVVLAEGVASQDVRAVGVLDGQIWLQLPDVVLHYPLSCRRPVLKDLQGEEQSEGTEPPDCVAEVREAPNGQTPIAHLSGSWEEGLTAVMKTAQRLVWRDGLLFGGSWSEEAPSLLVDVDLDDALGEAIYRRPDGNLSLDLGVRPVTQVEGTVSLLLPSGETRRFTDPEYLATPELDFGWLKFERAAGRFVFGSGREGSAVDADAVLSADGRFLPFLGRLPLQQPDGTILVATPFGLLSALAEPTLAQNRDATAFRSINLSQEQFQIDAGGLWQGDRYFPAVERDARDTTAAIAQELGALSVTGDRRVLGVRIAVNGVDAWQAGKGFAWDDLQDLGWSEGNRPVMQTPVGPVLIDVPLAPETPTDLAWSSGSFARLLSDQYLAAPPEGYDFMRTPDGRNLQFLQDALADASGAFNAMHLATGRGYERAKSFDDVPVLIASIGALDGFELHRPTGTLFLGRSKRFGTVGSADGRMDPLTEDELARLSNPVQYEIGPLSVVRLPDAGYRLEMPPFRGQSVRRPALVPDLSGGDRSRLAMDVVADVGWDQDGGLMTVGAAGITITTPGKGRALADTRLLSPVGADRSLALVHRESRLFMLEMVGSQSTACAEVLAEAKMAECDAAPEGSRLKFSTALGPLAVERIGNAITFLLDPEDGAPEMPVAYSGGRLAMDQVAQVATCGGRTHFVLEIGLRAEIEGTTGTWQLAKPVSRIDNRARLVCTEGHPDDRIANVLLVRGADGRWLALAPDGTAVAVRRSPFSLAAVDAALDAPRLEQGLTLLRADGDSSLAYEAGQGPINYLGVGGNLELLRNFEKLGPGATVDAPRFFIAGGGRIWAVTDRELYPFSSFVTSGKVTLDRAGPRSVVLPDACRTPLSAHWVSPDETDILCDGEVRVVLKLASDKVTFRVQNVRRSDLVVSGQLGLTLDRGLRLTNIALGDEALGAKVFDGGFNFDDLGTIAWGADGVLSVISAAGWHPYDGANLSLVGTPGLRSDAAAFRNRVGELRLARAVYPTQVARVLCFEVASGSSRQAVFIELSSDVRQLPTSQTDECTRFRTKDSLREVWWFPDGKIRFFHRLSATKTVEDTVAQGRFDGDRVGEGAGEMLPVLGQSDATLPTSYPFCVPSRLREIAIAGPIEVASARVARESCSVQRRKEPARADKSEFFSEDGTLFRRRVLEE